ncbi:hypothetical protein L210DRAFT_3423627 [Boletus edulis BED1]|uniref:Uncharacterized protein n=1 Tax=Boletus edulis BED1 TaxID=1328754 RepID=A0AAD4BEB4_BOLED|nr:hypothetical protein L210DRAFT_3423627 [Boletus edulis BED1]
MPIRKPWDHTIDMKDMFTPKIGHIISLSVTEQQEVSEFIDDGLKKGYIRPSKSSQTSPVFFIPKKDGQKCMVQDYRCRSLTLPTVVIPISPTFQTTDNCHQPSIKSSVSFRIRPSVVRGLSILIRVYPFLSVPRSLTGFCVHPMDPFPSFIYLLPFVLETSMTLQGQRCDRT